MKNQQPEDKMDKLIKFVLIFAALYFLLHIAVALADTQTIQIPPPVIRCITSIGGTVTCFPI
jgi:hypothetical protein